MLNILEPYKNLRSFKIYLYMVFTQQLAICLVHLLLPSGGGIQYPKGFGFVIGLARSEGSEDDVTGKLVIASNLRMTSTWHLVNDQSVTSFPHFQIYRLLCCVKACRSDGVHWQQPDVIGFIA